MRFQRYSAIALRSDEVRDVCIVGGGLAGLSTAHLLMTSGTGNIVVIEKNNLLGGLLRSEKIDGYTFDSGGSHIIFSKNKELLAMLLRFLEGNYFTHRRNTKIFYKGIFVKYPFENGLHDLPPEERYECLRDLILTYIRRAEGELSPPTNFEEWIRYVFGDAIAEKYLIPYNRKIWKTDLKEITLEWVGGRVPNPPVEDVMKAAVGLSVEGYTHQLVFHYPQKGGIYSLIEGILNRTEGLAERVVLGEEVLQIVKKGKILEVSTDARTYRCRAVVFTAPLKRSGRALRGILGDNAVLLNELKSIPVAVVGLGIKGKCLPYHWVYFPDNAHIFHRAAIISNFSPLNAPQGSSSVIAEISFPNEELLDATSDNYLIEKTVEGIRTICPSMRGVEAAKVWRWRDAYIVYDEKRRKVLDSVTPELRNSGVFPHGRFGGWDYLNMDMVFERSLKLVKEVLTYLNKSAV